MLSLPSLQQELISLYLHHPGAWIGLNENYWPSTVSMAHSKRQAVRDILVTKQVDLRIQKYM